MISNGIARGESKQSIAAKTYGALLIATAVSVAVMLILNIWPEQLLAEAHTRPPLRST